LGDVVLSVNGESTQGMEADMLTDRIVGDVGTVVSITFDSAWCTPLPSPPYFLAPPTSFLPPLVA